MQEHVKSAPNADTSTQGTAQHAAMRRKAGRAKCRRVDGSQFEPAVRIVSVLMLEELHGALMSFCCGSARESAEIAPAAGSRISLS